MTKFTCRYCEPPCTLHVDDEAERLEDHLFRCPFGIKLKPPWREE